MRRLYFLNRGFTLIELLLYLCFSSVILTICGSLVLISNNTAKLAADTDEVLLQGRYSMEYIKNEIKKSDRVISSDKIEGLNSTYPENIGFVLMQDNKVEKSTTRYTFITYYKKNNQLVRLAINKSKDLYPHSKELSGYNGVGEYLLSMKDTSVKYEDMLINLELMFGMENGSSHLFKSTIYADADFDYSDEL